MESLMALRNGGYDSEIHLFTDSSLPAMNPTLLTYYIAGKIGLDELFPYGDDMCSKYGVNQHKGSKVTRLDAMGKTVENADGLKMSYDHCVVCSGASPTIPAGYDGDNVFTIRAIHNATALKERVSAGKSALVVGASMIGVKVVEALVVQGMDVHLTDTQEQVFPLVAHLSCARLIEQQLRKKGVDLYLGTEYPPLSQYDLVVICAGVKPNIGFIDTSQVETDSGILVDKYMRTSCEGLYAAGDCTEMRGSDVRLAAPGLWASARYMGRAAGWNIAGKNEPCAEVVRHNITRFFDTEFVTIGEMHSGDSFTEMEAKDRYCRISWKDNRISGVNLINMPEISGVLRSLINKDLGLSPIALGMVFKRYPQIREAFLEREVNAGS